MKTLSLKKFWKFAGIPALAMAAGFTLAPAANASVIAYSQLSVDLSITAGGSLIGDVDVSFSSLSSAAIDGGGSTTLFGPGNGNAPLACVGSCGGIGEDDYSQISAGSGAQFARADSSVVGSLLPAGSLATGNTVAEIQGTTQPFAASTQSNTGSTVTVTITAAGDGVITLQGTGSGKLFATNTLPVGTASASMSWSITGVDANDNIVGGGAPIFWNQSRSAEGTYNVVGTTQTFDFFVLAGETYQLDIIHTSIASVNVPRSVSAPATLAMLGLGLALLGGRVRRQQG